MSLLFRVQTIMLRSKCIITNDIYDYGFRQN